MADSRHNDHRDVDKQFRIDRQQSTLSTTSSRSAVKQIPANYRRIVFSDPVAFRYLEEDEATIPLERSARLQGYELYVVEQWVCSRTHPTFIICTYTGDSSQSVLVNVLAIPNDEKQWSGRLKVYFGAISQFHAREQETTLGTLTVTNLSSFPSALTVISVPDGEVKKHKDELLVNENLKRMGCTGRVATTLKDPSASTVAKYHHLYATSEAVPLRVSVIELVKICQTALVLYGKLNPIYADGLLCDITERALSDWWDDIGTEFHNVEPSDGIFGPTTVAALLGLLVGAHNRLKAAGMPVGKEVLDIVAMKRAIGQFQRAYRINKTRRLDRETLDRLHRATAKVASGDGWAVPRAVKSTVAELSGKGGEMVMGIVGAKDKAGISEIETLDIERFAQIVPSARMKWLWQGKPIKSLTGDNSNRQTDEQRPKGAGMEDEGTFLWTSTSKEPEDDQDTASNMVTSHGTGDRKLGRLRDAVGIHGRKHHHHHIRTQKVGEDNTDSEEPSSASVVRASARAERQKPYDHVLKSPVSPNAQKSLDRDQSPKPALNLALATGDISALPHSERVNQLRPAPRIPNSPPPPYREQLHPADSKVDDSPTKRRVTRDLHQIHDEIQADTYSKFSTEFDQQGPKSRMLRKSRSALLLRDIDQRANRLTAMPRHLSFSVFDFATQNTSIDPSSSLPDTSSHDNFSLILRMMATEGDLAEQQEVTERLMLLRQVLFPHTQTEVDSVIKFDVEARESLNELNNTYYERLDEYQRLQAKSTDLIAREKETLNDWLRRIEVLGQKLDYELNSLHSRMQEVEDGAEEFERNVLEVEARVASLVNEKQNESNSTRWYQRAFRIFST